MCKNKKLGHDEVLYTLSIGSFVKSNGLNVVTSIMNMWSERKKMLAKGAMKSLLCNF